MKLINLTGDWLSINKPDGGWIHMEPGAPRPDFTKKIKEEKHEDILIINCFYMVRGETLPATLEPGTKIVLLKEDYLLCLHHKTLNPHFNITDLLFVENHKLHQLTAV